MTTLRNVNDMPVILERSWDVCRVCWNLPPSGQRAANQCGVYKRMNDLAKLTDGSEYHGFLIRLWRSSTDSQWRASLQDAATGEVFVFSELESMYLFLHTHTIEKQAAPQHLAPA